MTTSVPTPDRIAMSQKERDALKILHGALGRALAPGRPGSAMKVSRRSRRWQPT